MNAPWLSILIPVYNVYAYLGDCLASVLSQADDGIEIIIVDDKSTDGSYELLMDAVGRTIHKLKVIRHSLNQGISVTRNTLLEAATGEYLWFLDSDDVLADGAIKKLRNIVDKSSPDLIMCDYKIWRPEIARQKSKEQHIITFAGSSNRLLENSVFLFEGLYRKGKLHCWSKISKSCLWSELRFPEGQYFEDMVVTPRLAARTRTYFYLPEVLILYRKREGSILAHPSMKKINDMAAGVNGVLRLWLEHSPDLSASSRFIFIQYCVKIFFFSIKELKKMNQLNSESIRMLRELFYKNTELNPAQLIGLYLSRGRFITLIKLLRYL